LAKIADGKKITMVFPSPITSEPYAIESQWIDYNGHFNMAYYNVLFDRDSDVALALVGLGPAYVEKTGNSYFTLEVHVSYLRELSVTDRVRITTQVLDYDAKRLHYVQQMLHADEGWVACVTENIVMHVDLASKKSSAFPPDVLERIKIAHEAHKSLPVPLQVGHKIGIPRKT
jgi:acyl-CoA thioester hydrolase